VLHDAHDVARIAVITGSRFHEPLPGDHWQSEVATPLGSVTVADDLRQGRSAILLLRHGPHLERLSTHTAHSRCGL